MHRIGEIDCLVIGQAAEQGLVILDESPLLGLIGLGRQALRPPVLEAQTPHQLDAARMTVGDAMGGQDMRPHLAGVAVDPARQMGAQCALLRFAQITLTAMPVEPRQFVQAARTVMLVPSANRVVIKVKHPRHLGTAQPVIQE